MTMPMMTRADLVRDSTAYTARFRAEHDLYRMVAALGTERRSSSPESGVAFAMSFYSAFITKLASWPPSDQDALISVARRVFNVRVCTLRADLASAMAATPSR